MTPTRLLMAGSSIPRADRYWTQAANTAYFSRYISNQRRDALLMRRSPMGSSQAIPCCSRYAIPNPRTAIQAHERTRRSDVERQDLKLGRSSRLPGGWRRDVLIVRPRVRVRSSTIVEIANESASILNFREAEAFDRARRGCRGSCRAGTSASKRFTILKVRLVARGKVDAGAIKKIVPDRVRWRDHPPLAVAHDGDLLDAVRKSQAFGQA